MDTEFHFYGQVEILPGFLTGLKTTKIHKDQLSLTIKKIICIYRYFPIMDPTFSETTNILNEGFQVSGSYDTEMDPHVRRLDPELWLYTYFVFLIPIKTYEHGGQALEERKPSGC